MPLGLYSSTSTLLLSTAFTSAYVSSIYLFPASRVSSSIKATPTPPTQPLASDATSGSSPARDRNHPAVIRARLLAVTASSSFACLSVPVLLHYYPPTIPTPSVSMLLGLALPSSPSALFNLIAYPLGLTASLFLGSIYVSYLDQSLLPGQRWFNWSQIKAQIFSLQGVRNYLVGPWTEELVFRSAIVATSALGGLSKQQIIFLSPLYFGIAHVHHAYETYISQGRTQQALVNGVLSSTFQFAYTTLFGWYATYVFMRTGSIIPPFLIHTFCNWYGLPPIVQAMRAYPKKKISIVGSYVIGIATFIYGFTRWTEPSLFGGSWYWL